jgi:hypothetical protein
MGNAAPAGPGLCYDAGLRVRPASRRRRSGELDGRPRLTRCTRARRRSKIGRATRDLRIPPAPSGAGRAVSPIPPSCADPCKAPDRSLPPSRIGTTLQVGAGHRADLARLTGCIGPCSGSRAAPALGLAAWPVRGVICKSRPSPPAPAGADGRGPSQTRRPRAPGGTIVVVHLHRENRTALNRTPSRLPAEACVAATRESVPRRRSRARRPSRTMRAFLRLSDLETARILAKGCERGVQRFVTGDLRHGGGTPLLPEPPAGAACGTLRCNPTRVSPCCV